MTHERAERYIDHYNIAPHTHVVITDRQLDADRLHAVVQVDIGGKTWLFAFRKFNDHQSVDVDLFDDTVDAAVDVCWAGTAGADQTPNALATPIGVFSIERGGRHVLDGDLPAINHGWPATVGLVLLADHHGAEIQ